MYTFGHRCDYFSKWKKFDNCPRIVSPRETSFAFTIYYMTRRSVSLLISLCPIFEIEKKSVLLSELSLLEHFFVLHVCSPRSAVVWKRKRKTMILPALSLNKVLPHAFWEKRAVVYFPDILRLILEMKIPQFSCGCLQEGHLLYFCSFLYNASYGRNVPLNEFFDTSVPNSRIRKVCSFTDVVSASGIYSV
jgi:hypothetical protein